MNYYKFDLQSLFSSLFICSLFFSDFGILISGQSIYLFQMLAFAFLIASLFFSFNIEKGWLLFFLATLLSIFFNVTILSESRQFAGDTYPLTSIKAFINILLFYAVYKATIYSYYRINPNLFLYLSLVMILYGFLELFLSSNPLIKEFLQLFHTNTKALDKNSISLLGREHSYGALGFMCTACVLIYFYILGIFSGYKKHLSVICTFLLVLFVVIAKSKSVYIGVLLLSLLFLFLTLKQKKLTYSSLFILSSSLLALGFVVSIVIQNNFFNDAYESVSGGVGSGSTFIRYTNLYVAFMMSMDYPLFGVGPGNFKLFFVEYIYLLEIPIILELTALTDPYYSTGSIDPTNFFAGILSEFGFITFLTVFYILFKRVLTLLFAANISLKNVPLALLLSPVIFGSALGFYYWAVSFFPFFLAILQIDYKNHSNKKE